MTHLKNLFVTGILILISMGSIYGMEDSTKIKDEKKWMTVQFLLGSGIFENYRNVNIIAGSAFGVAPLYAQKIGGRNKRSTYLGLGLKIQLFNASYEENNTFEPLASLYLTPTIQLSDRLLLSSTHGGDTKIYLNPTAGIFANYLTTGNILNEEIEESKIIEKWTGGVSVGLGFIFQFSDEIFMGAGGQFEVAFSNPNHDEFSYSQLTSLYFQLGKTIGRSKKNNNGQIRQDF